MSNVVEIGAHTNMSVEETLRLCCREKFEDVMVIGYEDNKLVVRSSHMSRKDALWLLEQAKLHTLDLR